MTSPERVTKPKQVSKPKATSSAGINVAAKTTSATHSLSAKSFDIQGKDTGSITLPREIFGVKPNKILLATAVRVYQQNSISHTAHTKTRGEVRGGGAKPWRQKGTGRARAGSNRSPLWVGGGITFGPRFRKAKLKLPQKMRHSALISALSTKAKMGDIKVITNLEKIQPKTKTIAALLAKTTQPGKTILVIPTSFQSSSVKNIKLATKNLKNVEVFTPPTINTYQVLKTNNFLISKEALGEFK